MSLLRKQTSFPSDRRRIVLLRPGALGDVLVLRGVIRFLKDAFPEVELVLAAPGERGRFLCRPGWVDTAIDWERAMFSWLFSTGEEPPPPELTAALGDADLFISYIDAATGGDEHGEAVKKHLADLSPKALAIFSPSRPPGNMRFPIGEWMVRKAADFCFASDLLAPDFSPNLSSFCDARITITEPLPDILHNQNYAVLHPGSGSKLKNWPLARFIDLGRRLVSLVAGNSAPLFRRLVVVSGEADGDSGYVLSAAVPDSIHVHAAALEYLALLLANASLFVGNDSGVSHLASLVKNYSGDFPEQIVLFGPSDPAVWSPRGAKIIQANKSLERLSVEEVFDVIQRRAV